MSKAQSLVLALAALLLGLLVYLPGLGGVYAFDDFPNIVDNTALHVTTLDPVAWRQALWSSPSSDLQRPLASLSFALNYYVSGIDPLPMKITNLAIHLLNGWLLFVLLRRLTAAAPWPTPARRSWSPPSIAASGKPGLRQTVPGP